MNLPPVPAHLPAIEFMRVLTTYVVAAPLTRGRTVLDAGCGTGHGSWLMAERGARSVAAVDLSPPNAELVRRISRTSDRVHAAVMDVQALGFLDRRFDLIVCFEVIEHVPDPARLVRELRRVAAPGALTLFSTPNRRVRLRPGQRPWNPDHLREYEIHEIREILERVYPAVTILGIHGRGDRHREYLDAWRPTLARQVRTAVRDALPAAVRSVVRSTLARRAAGRARGPEIPAPEPSAWPFHVAEIRDDCLNLMAVCADDDRRVAEAATAIVA